MRARKAELATTKAVTINFTPTTRPVPSQRAITGNCEQYRSIVSQYDWDTELMLAIMRAESGCNPNGINWQDSHNGCVASYGLLQIACIHFKEGEDKVNPQTNIAVAYRVWKSQTYNAWSVYLHGSYKQFMK